MVNMLHEPTARAVPPDVRLRSGQAARLAGIPVATLRVWERRYGAIAAPKTVSGQRLYAASDVQRLRLLKQLTATGHAIGTIATLALDALQALAHGPGVRAPAGLRLVVVGRTAVQRLKRFPAGALQATYDGLDEAEAAGALPEADVLVLQLTSLQPATAARVLALHQGGRQAEMVVLYAFGTETVADSLRAAGVTVRREPVSGRELARLITGGPPAAAPAPRPAGAVAPRRFSDEALVELTELPSSVACECPRHVAEIVQQLAGFERYSAECSSGGPADAALHRQLSELAGMARTLFEDVLERVVSDEGLLLRRA